MLAASQIATRLCAACGMCCNGVLFYSIALQDSDSPRALEKVGLRVKRRRGGLHVLQPCPAHQKSQCGIYNDRPARCRDFHCRQLLAVFAGTTGEADAMEKINKAGELVARVRELFRRLGDDREHRDFSTRFGAIFTPPLTPGPDAENLREELRMAMDALNAFLDEHFRPGPPTGQDPQT